MLKLYHFDRSPFGWKVRVVLAEKHVKYEVVVPENKNEDPAFGKLNPYRLTPVLVLEDGRSIYESTAICEYLEETHPTPPMMPRDPYDRARIRMLEDATDQYLYPVVRENVRAEYEWAPPLLIRKPADTVDRTALEAARAKLHEHLSRLEGELVARTFFGGDFVSLADAALVPAITMTLPLIGVLPSPKYPNLSAWASRMRERPSWKASAPKEPLRIKEA